MYEIAIFFLANVAALVYRSHASSSRFQNPEFMFNISGDGRTRVEQFRLNQILGSSIHDVQERNKKSDVSRTGISPVEEITISFDLSLQSSDPYENPNLLQTLGQTSVSDNAVNLVNEELKETAMDIRGASRKVSAVTKCRDRLDRILKQIRMTNFPFSSEKIATLRSARIDLASCRAEVSIRKANAKYMGEAELAAADKRLKKLISTLQHSSSLGVSSEKPMDKDQTTYTKQNVKASRNKYFLLFNGTTRRGARVKSKSSFNSGIFSAKIKCPRGDDTSGLNTAFYLATDPGDPHRSSIIMEFYGSNRSIVSLGTITDGVVGPRTLVSLRYDCASQPHTYSIAWSSQRILWMSDKGVLDMVDRQWWKRPFPASRMHLFLQFSLINTVGLPQWVPGLGTPNRNFIASFMDLRVTSPVRDVNLPRLPSVLPRSPLYPVAADYCMDHMRIGQNTVGVRFDQKGCGGRFRSTRNYASGEFSAYIRCPSGDTSGLVTSFYLSTSEGDSNRDEIDFEFLGNQRRHVQTNVYIRGSGNNEMTIDLGFDCSREFHKYTIRYTSNEIIWAVDGDPKRTMKSADVRRFPKSSMFLYGSLWDGSPVLSGVWAGGWSGKSIPYNAYYKNFQITSPWRR